MGAIVKLLNSGEVETPTFNNYMSIELTENIHIHYRNLRLEFTPEEFLFIRELFGTLTTEEIETIKNREYGFGKKVIYLKVTKNLPSNDWWKHQFQIEKCRDGSVHFHLNNLRVDMTWNDYKKIFRKE